MVLRCSVAWLMLWLAACAAPQRDVAAGADALATPFQQHVNVLADPAMEGRGAGTAGLDQARDYLVAQFAALGLAPAFAEGFLQPFEIELGVEVTEQSLHVAAGDDAWTLDPQTDFSVLGFTGDGGFEGQAVFVGYAIDETGRGYDSFAGLGAGGLAGKVAVAFRYEPIDAEGRSRWARDDPGAVAGWSQAAALTGKADAVAKRGAVALLVVNPPSHDLGAALRSTRATQGPPAAIPVIHITAAVFERMLAAQAAHPRVMAEQLQRRADAGQPAVAELGEVRGSVRLERPRAVIANVAGRLDGSGELAGEVVVVGAHYDHLGYGEIGSMTRAHAIHPGADDNASGTAAVLLLADLMRHHAHAHPDAPRRTLLFIAFSGEERGLLGSMHFMQHLDDAGLDAERITAMLNFDMVGRMNDRWLYVFGVGSGDRWKDMVRRANRAAKLRLRFEAAAMGASDQVSFYVHRVPVLHLFTGVHDDYHRPSDTADKINAEGGAAVVRLSAALLTNLIHEPRRLAFREDETIGHGAASPSVHGGGGGAYLGVLPDYASLDAHDGCRLQAALTASPADHAGLRGGDVITVWNQRPIRNVRDLTAALAASEPGQRVELTIRRGGASLTIPVTLGSR